MKSLPRLALSATFAAMLAVSTHAVTVPLTTAGWNSNASGGLSGYWAITVPSTVNITTSVSVTAYSSSGGGGGSGISRNGTYVTGTGIGVSGVGSNSASNSAYNQPAGNYTISQGFGGPPNTVYGNVNTTLTW